MSKKCTFESVDDAGRCQTAKVHGVAGQLLDKVEIYHPYGFTTQPMPIEEDGKGAEGLLLDTLGGSTRAALPPQDRRYRPRGASNEGDVILYHYRDDPEASDPQSATARATFTDDGDSEGPVRYILRVGGATIEVIGADPPRIYIDTTNASIAVVDDSITVTAKDVTVNASGDVSVTAEGDVSVTSSGNASVDAGGSADITASSVSVSAASISLGA